MTSSSTFAVVSKDSFTPRCLSRGGGAAVPKEDDDYFYALQEEQQIISEILSKGIDISYRSRPPVVVAVNHDFFSDMGIKPGDKLISVQGKVSLLLTQGETVGGEYYTHPEPILSIIRVCALQAARFNHVNKA